MASWSGRDRSGLFFIKKKWSVCIGSSANTLLLMVFVHESNSKTTRQWQDRTNVEPVHSYDAVHTSRCRTGVNGIMGILHRFNVCLVVVLLWCVMSYFSVWFPCDIAPKFTPSLVTNFTMYYDIGLPHTYMLTDTNKHTDSITNIGPILPGLLKIMIFLKKSKKSDFFYLNRFFWFKSIFFI